MYHYMPHISKQTHTIIHTTFGIKIAFLPRGVLLRHYLFSKLSLHARVDQYILSSNDYLRSMHNYACMTLVYGQVRLTANLKNSHRGRRTNQLVFKATQRATCGPFYLQGLILILTWINNYIQMGDEITYLFTNFNSATVEVWKWISNFISHLLGMW